MTILEEALAEAMVDIADFAGEEQTIKIAGEEYSAIVVDGR